VNTATRFPPRRTVLEAPPVHLVSHKQDLDKSEGKTEAAGFRPSACTGVSERDPTPMGYREQRLHPAPAARQPEHVPADIHRVDLQAMFDGGVYADFVLFYLLLHRSGCRRALRIPRPAHSVAGRKRRR